MEHLLIVEDEKDIRESLQDILEMSGYKVSAAENGKVGLEKILGDCPDLVLCDVNMPVLDGFGLLGAVNERMKDDVIPPFLFLTAKVEKQDIRYGMNLGADDYILKPFDHVELLDIIRMRLEKRKKLTESSKSDSVSVNPFGKLALPTGEGLELVQFDDIIKCEADRAYCTFHMENGDKHLISKPMREFEDVLVENGFLRIHKSTIVNVKFAEKYVRGKGGMLVMADGSMVAVSESKKGQLMDLLNPKK